MISRSSPLCRSRRRALWTAVRIAAVAVAIGAIQFAASAHADWPTYGSDAARSGATTGSLPDELSLQWVHRGPAPRPAWPRSDRMPFDRAHHPVVADGRLFYGSTIDGGVYALDAASGEVLWRYVTDAPIRFAPAVWNDRVLVASDDGHLYALQAASGKLLWKHRGGPGDELLLGNERLSSRWPARGGPVVVDDNVYFAAGIWPSDGIYIYCLDAATGDVRWLNDDSGSIYMPQPHGGANAESGVSAQGYLVVAGDRLLVTTGRAVPATFDRHTGEFLYFHLQKFGQRGGSTVVADGDLYFNSGLGFSLESGENITQVGAGSLAVIPGGLVRGTANEIIASRWTKVLRTDRRGNEYKAPALDTLWTAEGTPGDVALAVAGDKIVAAAADRITLLDATKGETRWSAEVQGKPYGLAVADGRLYASTDAGDLYCFASGESAAPIQRQQFVDAEPYGDNDRWAEVAEEILSKTGVSQGYCVDLGCGDGRLAYELARRSDLIIYAVSESADEVAQAREKLTAAGLYGSRVTVHHRPLDATTYPKYFADLVVSQQSIADADASPNSDEVTRLQRPFGGQYCNGAPGEIEVAVRGPLEGAGRWTHQYANPANTLNSNDALVGGRLNMLWYRDIDLDLPQRHGRAPSPLYADGRLFHQGLDAVIAVDAYNGRELWRYEVPGVLRAYNGDELMGTAGTHSNICLGDDSLFVRDGGRCLRLDAATGELLGELSLPSRDDGEPSTWGYVAFADGILYGTDANDDHVVTYRYVNRGGDMSKLLTESQRLFALNPKTGAVIWQYQAEHSIRHNAIAIGGGRLYLIDRPLAMFDRVKKPQTKEHPYGELVALDASTGNEVWRQSDDVFGTTLILSEAHDVLLMGYQPTRFKLDSEFGGRLAGYRATSGERLWNVEANYQTRPLINGDTVYAQGGAWDVTTGKPRPFDFSRSYGCGIITSSQNTFFFRSATLGYFNVHDDQTTRDYGGVRPGCWINAIPAGGLVLVPDASAGCVCSYLNQAWFALDSTPVQ